MDEAQTQTASRLTSLRREERIIDEEYTRAVPWIAKRAAHCLPEAQDHTSMPIMAPEFAPGTA